MRRQTVSSVESGARQPSLGTLVNLLAAAGLQMRVELEPLDADVRRAIEDRLADSDPTAHLVGVWGGFREMDEVTYRLEGPAAAALLGAPVPVRTIEIALADSPATHEWLAARLRCYDLSLRPDGWRSSLSFDRAGEDFDGASVKAALSAECPDGRFWLVGWFSEIAARFAPPEVVARCVHVATSEGTVRVQPLHEIVSDDPRIARVLRVLRDGPAGPVTDGRIVG